MAATIRLKRSTGTAAPSSLATGEIAYSYGAGTSANLGDRLFFGKGDDGAGNATSIVPIGGEYFANLLDHTPGTLTASSALLVDANGKVDNFKVDNLDLDGNTISSTDTNGNIVISPNGSGSIDADTSKIINVTDPTSAQDAATKSYVDTVAGSKFLTILGDTGSDTVNLSDSSVDIAGGTGLSTAVTDNLVTINLDNTTVSAGSYGSSTEIATFTVDAQGRLTAAGTASISSSLSLAGETGTGSVSLLDSSLSFVGGSGISTSVTGREVTITTVDGEIVHDNLSGFVSNEHIDHSTVDITAGAGLTGGGDLTATRTLNVVGGDGITVNADEVEVTVDNSTLELSATNGTGAVRIKDGGVTNAKLANSSITIGTDAVSLGGTITDLNGLTQLDVDNIRLDGNTISSTDGSNTLYIDPAPVDSDGGELIIRGNLTVQGTTTTVNSTTVSINDKNLVLADSAANAAEADGAGLTVNGAAATITYDAGTDRWDFNKPIDIASAIGTGLYFNGVAATEAIEDHLVSNFFLAGEGIDLSYDDGANTLTVAAELATVSNAGVASFDSAQMTVTSGFVTIYELDGGTY